MGEKELTLNQETLEAFAEVDEMKRTESGQHFAGSTADFLACLAWDPDFTKLTPAERWKLEEAEKDIVENGTISHDSINWD